MPRNSPYSAFNFVVSFGSGEALGGFSDVSGLDPSTDISAYREGGRNEKPVRIIPGARKAASITLRRGVVDARQFSAWLAGAKSRGAQARRVLTLVLRDEKGMPVRRWKLAGVVPLKYTGPTLAAKGGGDVAMEELVLSSEGIELE